MLIDCIELETTLCKIEDLSNLCPTRQSLMLASNVAMRDTDARLGRGCLGSLTLDFKVCMSHHHQLDMTFNRKQIAHLIITPAERLLGESVEILDFPPAQIVADNGLGRERLIGADEIAPFPLPDDSVNDQSGAMTARQATSGRPDLVASGVDGHEVKRPLGQDLRPLFHLQVVTCGLELPIRLDGTDEMETALVTKIKQVPRWIPTVGQYQQFQIWLNIRM